MVYATAIIRAGKKRSLNYFFLFLEKKEAGGDGVPIEGIKW